MNVSLTAGSHVSLPSTHATHDPVIRINHDYKLTYFSISVVLTMGSTLGKNIILDFQEVKLVDHTVMTGLKNLQSLLKERGQSVSFVNTEHLTPVSEHPLAARLFRTDSK